MRVSPKTQKIIISIGMNRTERRTGAETGLKGALSYVTIIKLIIKTSKVNI